MKVINFSEKNDEKTPFVSVLCQTYNHELYIRECLDGILMQKTDFWFDILIHDDASLDNTAHIIKAYETKYPNIIKPIYQHINQFSQGQKILTGIQFPRVRAKYTAFCEGDDYWTDPYKLQKQVDFLEKNTEYGLIYSKVRCFLQSKNIFEKRTWGGPSTQFDALINKNTIPTLTTVFRTNICQQYLEEFQPKKFDWKLGDYPVWLYFALKSKIWFSDEITGVYRISTGSISRNTDIKKQEAYIKSIYTVKIHLFKLSGKDFSEELINEELNECLGTNALLMKNRTLASDYFCQIKRFTLKRIIKRILSKSGILTYFYIKAFK